MRIAVFGAGGVGGYFGGRLAQIGTEVVFISRGAHLEAIRQHGLQVDSIKGDFSIQPAQAESDPGKVGIVDAVILGVKAWQVAGAAQEMRLLVGPATLVLPLQNGVDAPTELAAVLDVRGSPKPHVLGGLCRISAFIAEPGHIRHVGIDPYLAFNRLDGQPDERVEKLAQAFRQAGVNVEMPADIHSALWAKFAFIATLSGVGAVTRAPAGVMRSLPEVRALLQSSITEVEAVGRACGVALPADIAARTLATIDNLPPATTASMHRDIIEGRPSELESQNGALVRLGRLYNVPTPVHAFLYAALAPQEQRAHQQVTF